MGDIDICVLPTNKVRIPQEYLPRKAQNLARRVEALTKGRKGIRVKFELIVVGNSERWFLAINDGEQVEDLGE